MTEKYQMSPEAQRTLDELKAHIRKTPGGGELDANGELTGESKRLMDEHIAAAHAGIRAQVLGGTDGTVKKRKWWQWS